MMEDEYVIRPFTYGDFVYLSKEEQKLMKESTFPRVTAEEMFNSLILAGCRCEMFQIFTPSGAVGVVIIQFFPCGNSLFPIIHHHIYKGKGRKALLVGQSVITALCDHWGLDCLNSLTSTINKDGQKYFELLKRRHGSVKNMNFISSVSDLGNNLSKK